MQRQEPGGNRLHATHAQQGTWGLQAHTSVGPCELKISGQGSGSISAIASKQRSRTGIALKY